MTKNAITAASDTLYSKIVGAATECHRRMEHSNLEWYWNMGALHSKFEDAVAQGLLGEHTIKTLIEDLATQDIHLAQSTLYMARQIHDAYKHDALLDMVDSGIMVSHLKQLLPLEGVVRDQAESMLRNGGKTISVAALTTQIDKLKQKAIAKETKAALKYEASEPEDLLADAPEDENGKSKGAKVSDEKPKGKDAGKDADKPAKAGPTGGKDFTVSPVKAFCTADKVALKLTEHMPDVIIAAKELTKIGYNSDAAQKKAKDALKDVRHSLKTLAKTLEEVLIVLAEASDAD
jgi:hypothetical protein